MKKPLTLIIAFAMALSLAACGSNKDAEETATTEDTQVEVQVAEKEEAAKEPAEEPETEEPETQEEIPEEDEKPDNDNSPFAFEIDDPVIYDAEGVTVTMDEWSLENSGLSITFSVTNHNPDNKKASFDAKILVDGSIIDHDGFGLFQDIAVDESRTRKISTYLNATGYYEFKEMIGAESMQIDSLVIKYDIQIGSDSEPVPGNTIFRNPELGDDFSKIYGDKIDEFSFAYRDGYDGNITELSYEIYRKHLENDYILITIKEVDDLQYAFFPHANGIETLASMLYNPYSEEYACCYVYDTPENLRKENEIANDAPIEAVLYYVNISDGITGEPISVSVTLD